MDKEILNLFIFKVVNATMAGLGITCATREQERVYVGKMWRGKSVQGTVISIPFSRREPGRELGRVRWMDR